MNSSVPTTPKRPTRNDVPPAIRKNQEIHTPRIYTGVRTLRYMLESIDIDEENIFPFTRILDEPLMTLFDSKPIKSNSRKRKLDMDENTDSKKPKQ